MADRLIKRHVCEPVKCYYWLMKTYNWQQPDWLNFRYDLSLIQDKLLAIAEKTGLILLKKNRTIIVLQNRTFSFTPNTKS